MWMCINQANGGTAIRVIYFTGVNKKHKKILPVGAELCAATCGSATVNAKSRP